MIQNTFLSSVEGRMGVSKRLSLLTSASPSIFKIAELGLDKSKIILIKKFDKDGCESHVREGQNSYCGLRNLRRLRDPSGVTLKLNHAFCVKLNSPLLYDNTIAASVEQ
jgi:hypothetical protein